MFLILCGALFSFITIVLLAFRDDTRAKEMNKDYYYYLVENEHHVRSIVRSNDIGYTQGDTVMIDQYSFIVKYPSPYSYAQKARVIRWISIPN